MCRMVLELIIEKFMFMHYAVVYVAFVLLFFLYHKQANTYVFNATL